MYNSEYRLGKGYLHVVGEAHACVKVGNEDLGHVLDEGCFGNEAVVVDVEHLKEPVVDDTRKVAVLDEGHLV
jgi:hypothetical protein